MHKLNIYKDCTTAFNTPIKFEIYSFIGCIKTFYDLPPNVVNRIEYIVKCVSAYRRDFSKKIPYENLCLGITMFAMEEFNKRAPESPPFDISKFTKYIYAPDKYQKNIEQIYYVYIMIDVMFN